MQNVRRLFSLLVPLCLALMSTPMNASADHNDFTVTAQEVADMAPAVVDVAGVISHYDGTVRETRWLISVDYVPVVSVDSLKRISGKMPAHYNMRTLSKSAGSLRLST